MPTLYSKNSNGVQTSYGLITDLNSTGGKALPIIVGGVQYWARLATSPVTDIAVKQTDGITYYVQTDPYAWVNFNKTVSLNEGDDKNTTTSYSHIFPMGSYKITIQIASSKNSRTYTYNFTVSNSGTKTVKIITKKTDSFVYSRVEVVGVYATGEDNYANSNILNKILSTTVTITRS